MGRLRGGLLGTVKVGTAERPRLVTRKRTTTTGVYEPDSTKGEELPLLSSY